ncbi:MAG TPA: acyl-CoA dehydratase activase [Acidobacteriota bacterium]|nr:acyl-CoA dehydratase activase [Acidobacteriota bacterium]
MKPEPVYGGIDVGASATKAALIDDKRRLLGADIRKTGVSFEESARDAMTAAMASAGLSGKEPARIIATGYGRHNVEFAGGTRTEIACHARAAHFHFPGRITVVDVGGQDNKIIHVDAEGRRENFKMNRKCAAGTGAFLEEVAQRMDVPLDRIDELARQAAYTVHMGSYCTVFTKTEILAHIRAGEKVPEIVAGLIESVVKRIVEMDTLTGDVVMTGGVAAHNPMLAEMLARRLNRPVKVLPNAQLAGAFGAALLAAED